MSLTNVSAAGKQDREEALLAYRANDILGIILPYLIAVEASQR